ncbi:8-amino-7-oxononanoate synthase [bacterium]|nr:8-amino-7-oxononanoate synthase [bacterium]
MIENYRNILENLEENSHLRHISDFEWKDEKYIFFKGKKLLNLSSNNYLGFADNQKITEEFLANGGGKYSFGSGSARLLTGTLPVYKELEDLITNLYNSGGTLLFNSGYHANVGINSSLTSAGDVIFSDKLNHASIIDGMQLARSKFFRYPHNNMESLEKLLQRERKNFNNAVIVTESVFSMDGDIADLEKIVELKKRYNCLLVVDEAHAFGVFGQKGLGVLEEKGLIAQTDLIIGTFGKSIGSMGAFATGKKELIDYLTNKARSFIFSTALPPITIAFSKFIIENKLPFTFEKRKKMLELGQKFKSQSQIIPVIIGGNKETIEKCDILYQNGYFTLPIRPPTVPEGTSRLRLSLTTEIEEKDLEKLCNIIG